MMIPRSHLSTRRRPDLRSLLSPAAGLAIVFLITAIDLHSDSSIVIGTVVLGAFVTALIATPRQTALVALVAASCAVLSGMWNDDFLDGPYLLRVVVVLVGGVMAVLAAHGRERGAAKESAFALLTALSRTVDEPMLPSEAIARVEDLLVPAIADVCAIDVVQGGAVRRMSVKARGPRAAEIERAVLDRPPNPAESGVGVLAALRADTPQLIQVDDELLRRMARDAGDLAQMRAIEATSSAVLPLRARGQLLGTLTLSVTASSGRRYAQEDLEFFAVVAGRVSLTIDNAGLTRHVQDLELQLGTALGGLSEAVTVTSAEGRTVYANPAALELLGFASEAELFATEPGDVMDLYEITDEAGRPVALGDLPASRLLRGERDVPPLLVRNVVKATGEERWLLNSTSPVYAEDGSIARVVNVIENVTAFKRAERNSRLLAEASDVLASSLDYEETLQRVAEMAVPELADWCRVSLPDARGIIRSVAVAHIDPSKVALARRLGEEYPERAVAPGGAAQVIRTGVPQLVNDVSDDLLVAAAQGTEHLELLRGLGIHAGMTVPVPDARGGTLGALSLVSAESRRSFTEADLLLAQELARRAGVAVENARLYSERAEIANTLQEALLPEALPEIAGLRADVLYRPVGELNYVGGDFYDLFQTPRGWMAVVGDVTGHGAKAARLTAMARARLRAIGELTGDPLMTVSRLNGSLCEERELTLVTAVIMCIEARADGALVVEIVCCGHPRPILVSALGSSEVGTPGVILGLDAGASWEAAPVELLPGDSLVAYTDGIIDTFGERELFGVERLLDALAPGNDPEAMLGEVAARVDAFRHRPQRDDEALLVLQAETRPTERRPGGALPDAATA